MRNKFYRTFGKLPYLYFFEKDVSRNASVIFDFFDTMTSIYVADISEKRIEDEQNNLEINVPVVNIDIFNKLKPNFIKLANFVSGDRWNIEFEKIESKILPGSLFNMDNYNSISLLSGGLDSFCGSFHEQNNNTLFVGFKINNREMNRQKELTNFLKVLNSKIELKLKKITSNLKKEVPTQRTRSLLFLAFGVYYADFFGLNNLNLYENGVLSLNPNILNSRKTTKTTHPRTLYLYNKILKELDIKVEIKHPFLFKTKGEIINDLNIEFKDKIKKTVTCGMSRQSKRYIWDEGKQCGVCIACILRKISICANNLEDYDAEYDVEYSRSLNKEEFIRIDLKNREQTKDYSSGKIATYVEHSNGKYFEYYSGIHYFKELKRKIDNNEIYDYLDLNPYYYEDLEYYSKTDSMLRKFSNEVAHFIKKYNL